jgi:hypothetical protein
LQQALEQFLQFSALSTCCSRLRVTSSFINDSWESAGGANNASLPVIHKVTFDYLKSFAKRSVLVQCSGQSFLQASASLHYRTPAMMQRHAPALTA